MGLLDFRRLSDGTRSCMHIPRNPKIQASLPTTTNPVVLILFPKVTGLKLINGPTDPC